MLYLVIINKQLVQESIWKKSFRLILFFLYKLLTSTKGTDDLFIGFDRSRDRIKRELTDNKNNKGKYHLRSYLKDIFGFAEHQEVASYGLSYNITINRNTDNAVLIEANATLLGKIKFNSIE